MPIYDQTYRRYEAREALRSVRSWPITREALRLVLAKRAFLGLLALAWIPFVVRSIQVYVVTRFPQAEAVLPVDGRLFGSFLNQQLPFLLLLSVFGGSGLVANDLRTGGILVYLSRPLTRRDYVLGKLGAVLALNLSATLVPGLLLYLVALALAPDRFLAWRLLWIAPAVVLHALVLSLAMGLGVLAVSSLSRSARVAGLAFVGLYLGLEIVRLVARQAYDPAWSTLVSFRGNLQAVGEALFGLAESGDGLSWGWPALALALVGAGCLWVLRVRVRAVEVIR